MAYRPQANGSVERMVQTLTRALKMYVADVNQMNWDEYTDRLTLARNTAHHRIRGDTPFYAVHVWDARSTLEASIPMGSTRRRDFEPRRWRYSIQRQYQQAREQINEALRAAIGKQSDRHNEGGGGEVDRHAVRLETAGTEYRLFPTVHLSKLKLVKAYLDRPAATLTNDGIDRDDFDENLLAEESWEGEQDDNEFEVERIADVRSGRRTRYG
ncbi:hypothetical protein PC129_g4803 [Phytophthora cactorum]|uniref:Integrase catalytic domain-containing protein n=1 Tax=Phytophthora cactorum TaxID=29920 RepID=A0A8T1IKC5_9STRA|nr:hypothetical protein PC111_g2554 [Phytophthora cactorum]KAG2931976.1 hypothetical protein PC114_g2006 [Phytophthora cactorum]KAG2953779.1 hypothetical protein PC117_g1764 [Phytophthora cactorum]KAG3038673.1 hypothetical protein PC119_g2754 [Phytophthora cactorum]KAG3102847.1 hypothetical protein PC122_g2112 [Phytophthora cactorum]